MCQSSKKQFGADAHTVTFGKGLGSQVNLDYDIVRVRGDMKPCLPKLLEPGGDAISRGIGIQYRAIAILTHRKEPATARDAIATACRVWCRSTAALIPFHWIPTACAKPLDLQCRSSSWKCSESSSFSQNFRSYTGVLLLLLASFIA